MTLIKERILQVYGREPESLDELARCVIAVIENQKNDDYGQGGKNYRVAGFAWDIHYRDLVSNTHSSPAGLPQNWRGEAHLPKGYPGWMGRVWIRYAEPCRSFGSSPFDSTLTHTGTGGAGGYGGPWETISAERFRRYGHKRVKDAYPEICCYSWDYRIYQADWPKLTQWVEKQQIWSELSGKPWLKNHTFEWNDPEVLAQDAAFLAECATIKAKESAVA